MATRYKSEQQLRRDEWRKVPRDPPTRADEWESWVTKDGWKFVPSFEVDLESYSICADDDAVVGLEEWV